MSFNDGFNIRAVPWPQNTPVSGNSLVYDGTKWVAANVSSSGGGGSGDITAVNAGTNLTGGGDSGDVTVSLSSSVIGLTNLQTAVLTASNITGSELNIDHIDFATENATNPTFQTGRLYYDVDTLDLQYNTVVSGTSINLGQQLVVKVKNDTNTTINKGKLVRISGGLGNNPTIATASWENDANSANTLGMLMSTLDHNDFGYVLLNGILLGVNTDTYSAGQTLYLSSSGDYTNIKPVAPRHMVRIGEVVRVGNSEVGSVFVNVQNGYELDELHDVLFSSASNGDLLVWDDSVSLWKNGKTLSGSYVISGTLTASNVSSINYYVQNTSSNDQSVYIRRDQFNNMIFVDPNVGSKSLQTLSSFAPSFSFIAITSSAEVLVPASRNIRYDLLQYAGETASLKLSSPAQGTLNGDTITFDYATGGPEIINVYTDYAPIVIGTLLSDEQKTFTYRQGQGGWVQREVDTHQQVTTLTAGSNISGSAIEGNVTIALSSSVTGLTNLETTVLTASNVTGTIAEFTSVTASFSGSGNNITSITASNISNFTNDVRAQFSAGTNIKISSGQINSSPVIGPGQIVELSNTLFQNSGYTPGILSGSTPLAFGFFPVQNANFVINTGDMFGVGNSYRIRMIVRVTGAFNDGLHCMLRVVTIGVGEVGVPGLIDFGSGVLEIYSAVSNTLTASAQWQYFIPYFAAYNGGNGATLQDVTLYFEEV
jgi:hypothetical protein